MSEADAPADHDPAKTKGGWFARLKSGLAKSSAKLGDGLTAIFNKRRLDEAALEDLEELLITADMGVATAARLAGELGKTRFDKEVSPEAVREALAASITEILEPVARPLVLSTTARPHIVLMVGVNGSGKTTTIGKMAKHYRDRGLSVMLAAGDTFRAAAIEQLQIWGERIGCEVVARAPGADAAGLAYEALERAQRENVDLLMIDTAGRLHNKADLMAELQKIVRVIRKLAPDGPQDIVLVLDATTGQNALAQVATFKDLVEISGLVVTKLDGSARGGVLVALAETHGLPVHAVGVGEAAEDLRPFSARDFARGLLGLEG